MEKYSVIGKRLPRLDSIGKVTGDTKYTDDMLLPGMLYGKILRSPYSHARIIKIDTAKAERLPGVRAVITGKDISDIPHGLLRIKGAPPFFRDKYAIAKEKVRYIGDEVAAVAAIDEDIAMDALDLIEVEYEVLPAVFDPIEALKPGAPKVHDKYAETEGNLSTSTNFSFGDIEKGFAESDLVLEDHFEMQFVCHTPLEPHSVIADFSHSGDVTLWLSTQVPFLDQVVVAETLEVPVSRVRVIKPPVGGGFGGKADTHSLFPIAALLSKKSGKPVKIIHTREEELVCTSRRHPVIVDHKTGVKKDGKIMAVESKFITDGGAYMSYGWASIYLHGILQFGPYYLDNYKYDGFRAYTNNPYSGAQRGHGGIQARFVVESMMDMIAEKLNLDPLEIRKKNGLKRGVITKNKFNIRSCGHVESIDKSTEEIGWKDKWKKLPDGKGVGIACNFYCSGGALSFFIDDYPSHSGVNISAEEDGAFTVFTGSSDVGQGSETTCAQIAAETLGVGIDKIKIVAADTGITPVDFGTYSSRVTMFAGNATKNAAIQMKQKLLETAAEALEAHAGDLEAREGKIYVKGSPDKGITVTDTIKTYFRVKKEPLTAHGHYNPPSDIADVVRFDTGEVNLTPAFSFGAYTTEVDVDKETGVVKILKIAAAHDCGFAINPMAVEGQIEGCVSMSLGQAFTEDFRVEQGCSMTNSLLDYKLPTAADMPPVKSIIVESIDTEGPFGAKESSEGPTTPTMPAIANAIYDAIGVRIKTMPITPEKVLRALEKKGGK